MSNSNRYYVRPIFSKIKTKDSLFLGSSKLFFNEIELITRGKTKTRSKFLKIDEIKYLENETTEIKNKVYFIHMNHTNPLLDPNSDSTKWVVKQGFNVARIGQEFEL